MSLRFVLCCALLSSVDLRLLHAQDKEQALSEGEIDKLRDTAPEPPARLSAFIGFLDRRADRIDKLNAGKRQPGREEDIHALTAEMTSILDDLDDNLEDWDKRHADLRKALPKLITAAERWNTSLNSSPENEEYRVARKLALESLHDVQETAGKMLEEQKVWFKDHPPSKENGSKSGLG